MPESQTLREQEDATLIFAPQPARKPHITKADYARLYAESINNPDKFWAAQAQRLDWLKEWRTVKETSFTGDVSIRWFAGGKLNVAANCIDRHLEKRGDQAAIIWEGDNPAESKHITYKELHREVYRFANVLKGQGVKKGDVVTIYMPMIPEAAYAMLACARIGAVHSVVFGGFSPEALKGRIEDCHSRVIITADEGVRGGKTIPLKANVDGAFNPLPRAGEGRVRAATESDASALTPTLSRTREREVTVIVIRRTGNPIAWNPARDVWYHEAAQGISETCEPEPMGAEDPLFILYTSGSTGKPKGIKHTTAGYLLFAALSHETVFDYQEGDIYWCTADVGWVTGHSYSVYGPLANGATTLMFEGVPSYPDASRFWQVIDKHKVTQFYTAPTAIRALRAQGDAFVTQTSRRSLRVLGSVGEPINPEAWLWYHRVVGDSRCPIVDTWWQTETGGFLITPFPYATDLKPGSATLPFFGVKPVIVDANNVELEGECEGNLCINDSWPGQACSIHGDHARFIETYFKPFPGRYFSGDGCRRDKDGYYWITGRSDDVIKVSGHRIGTAEIESALVAHERVTEAAVVGYPHPIKGQGIYVFVQCHSEQSEGSHAAGDPSALPQDGTVLRKELIAWVRKEIGAIATPDLLQFVPGLPKTRSGKIMRRILRKIAENEFGNLGDISTLLNPDVVEKIIAGRLNR